MVCKGAQGGASLVLAFNGNSQRQREVLIVGGGKLAALRTVACLEADFNVTLAYDVSVEPEPELQQRLSTGEITFAPVSKDEHLVSWMEQRLPSLAFVIIADTLSTQCQRSKTSCSQLSEACRARRIPINIADQPQLSDFTFPTTHRFTLPDDPDKKSSLQLSVTTSSSACRLATRIKRQAVAALPLEVGLAADKICQARKALKHVSDDSLNGEEENQLSNINRPVAQRSRSSADASFPKLDTQARLRFVAQMCRHHDFIF